MSTRRVSQVGAILAAVAFGLAGPAHGQAETPRVTVRTRAEASDYRETSRYADVQAFLAALEGVPNVHFTSFGYTFEGRALPLVVVGRVADASAAAVRAAGKTRVYVQADIHAGEVAGKEAVLELLRELANGAHGEWLDSLVVLIAPIYNADGNERVRLTNRPAQLGPVGGMGQRANAQNLDLNRDHMKLESPEARSLALLLRDYDPHVALDLHTTDGTRHAYRLTYAPPLHPATDTGIVGLLRNDWLPTVRTNLRAMHGWEYFLFGDLPYRSGVERGWYTYGYGGRYNTNYIGLRNRIGILSEAYAYAPFDERIRATKWFVEAVLDYATQHATRIREVTAAADRASIVGRYLALRATYHRGDSIEVLLGEVTEERNPYTGRVMLRRVDVAHRERLPDFGTFDATDSARAPQAYLVPVSLGAVRELLEAHGVQSTVTASEERRSVERFVIDSSVVAAREFQGHRERTLFGHYERVERPVPTGTIVVPMSQPLARLVFSLLEPRSDDGVVDWNVLDRQLDGAAYYPILRIPSDR